MCKGPDCRRGGAEELHAACKKLIAEQPSLSAACDVGRGGCYGLCHVGPSLIVRETATSKRDPFNREDFQLMGWPGEYHYPHMNLQKLERVLQEHVGEGKPVADYLSSTDESGSNTPSQSEPGGESR